MPEVFNTQRKIPIGLDSIRKFASRLSSEVAEAEGKEFCIAFVPDERMRQLNEMFRGKDSTTDVLSFPNEHAEFEPDKNSLGDIVISAEQAQKQAAENGLSLEGEISQLILHGVLHLCGYDHETDGGEMNTRELQLREKLGI